ncbi:MAG: hypothetical protein IKM61_04650 [Eubacteriaceae bacterium]|nr:hypothetical protein [Eubacteriaceae bacterium]
MKYVFTDTDESGFEEYDIEKDEYLSLLKICFRYSSTVSFRIWNEEVTALQSLAKFRIPPTEKCVEAYSHYYKSLDHMALKEIRHYILSDEVKNYVLSVTDSIFGWINGWGYHNPEDICFYRHDGSIFFSSVIHDGICCLDVGEDEDADEILKNKLWRPY